MAEYRPWYERFPERFAEEKAEMAERGFVLDEEALARQAVVFSGRSRVDPERELMIEYPDAFPSLPPHVVSDKGEKLLTAHQTPGVGGICTFGPRQARWSASLSGTAAVDEAEEVIRDFRPGAAPPAEAQLPEPPSATYHYAPDLYFLVPPPLNNLPREASERPITGTFRLIFKPPESSGPRATVAGRGIVIKAETGEGVLQPEKQYRKWLQGPQEYPGTLVILPQPPPYIDSADRLKRWLAEIGVRRADWMAFVFPEGDRPEERYWSWVVARTRPDHTFFLGRTFVMRPPGNNVRVPGTAGLSEKKVSVIGCGCLGSKIAVALAATGVSQIFLLDRDYFEPDNSIRHECGVKQFGTPKVEAVLSRVLDMNPEINYHATNFDIGGRVNVNLQRFMFEHLASSHLVIDATGVHGVSRFVNDVSHELGVASLYVSVTNGAWGGEVVRAVPGKTACWMCWYKQYEGNAPSSEPAPELGVFAPGCDQPTFTGTTYETGMVANLAAWMAVETLLAGSPGREDFKGDYIRWSGRDREGVPAPLTEVLPTIIAEDCPLCQRS